MNRIVVAVDGSEASDKAARLAADIALRFGAKLTLVHVVPRMMLPPDAYGLSIADVEREHRAYAEKLVEEAVVKLNEPGIEVDTQIRFGSPAEEIAGAAAEPDVGLVVVGRRGRGAVARVLLGSVSDRLVHISPKSVLVAH